MGEPFPGIGDPNATSDGEAAASHEPVAKRKTVYHAYRPPNSEFTPPASPPPSGAHGMPMARPGFASHRNRHPTQLETDLSATPAYERPQYSPSPSSSPPPPLPSPFLAPRQRTPSLLRHAAASSPLNDGFPRAEQPAPSPTFSHAGSMIRQHSGQGPTSDPRTYFNPLQSNPVGHSGPAWRSSREDLGWTQQNRARGLTSASQPHPILRNATSIPDYGQYRSADRPNLSGAYRPNRGGTNWSHNDNYSAARPWRVDEPRASFRSCFTNGSSFVDASGTERSSMATRWSSTSDTRGSISSRERLEFQELTRGLSQSPDEDDDVESAVDDFIDSYRYHDDIVDIPPSGLTKETSFDRVTLPTDTSDTDVHNSSRTSLSIESKFSLPQSKTQATRSDSKQPNDRSAQHTDADDNASSALVNHRTSQSSTYSTQDAASEPPRFSQPPPESWRHDRPNHDSSSDYLPHLDMSPLKLQHSPGNQNAREFPLNSSTMDTMLRDEQNGTEEGFAAMPAEDNETAQYQEYNRERQPFDKIQHDLKNLPKLPNKKSRISRQDWAEIQAYSKRNGTSQDADSASTNAARSRLPLAVPRIVKESSPLPEIDENDVNPRRASTSVYDRRSVHIDLNAFAKGAPMKSNTVQASNPNAASKQRPSADPKRGGAQRSTSTAFRIFIDQNPRDRYGFKKATDQISVEQYDKWYNGYVDYVERRRRKWKVLMQKCNLPLENPSRFPDRSEKVKRYARKGFPPEWRGEMWWYYAGGQAVLSRMTGIYPQLAKRVQQGELNKDDREAIERDLDRTFPDNIQFKPEPPIEEEVQGEPGMIKDLREVLQCFALQHPNIGYCQSLNFIAGMLLLFLKGDRERVFILLHIITHFHFPGAHSRNLANTDVHVLMMLIKDHCPKVWNAINDTDIINKGLGSNAHPNSKFQRLPTANIACTSWFMSLFINVLPTETALRCWDAFLYEGPRALFRYAVAIFKVGEPQLRKFHPSNMSEICMTVQELPKKMLDPNVLHDTAFVKGGLRHLTQASIDEKRAFWREQNAMDKKPLAKNLPNRDKSPIPPPTPTDSRPEGGRGLSGLRRKASKRFTRKKT